MALITPAAPATVPPALEATSFALLLGPQRWSALQLAGRVRGFSRGSTLSFEGDSDGCVMVLLEGRVKITHTTIDGHEMVISILGPGEIIGELPCLDERPQLGSVRALEPVRALVIDAGSFRYYIATTPEAALALLEVLRHRLRDAILKRSEFASSDTIGRLAARLVELAERYGRTTERGIVIGLPLSQEELAGWAGACHASLAKALQVLRELGWIETERRRIVVHDLGALRSRSAQPFR